MSRFRYVTDYVSFKIFSWLFWLFEWFLGSSEKEEEKIQVDCFGLLYLIFSAIQNCQQLNSNDGSLLLNDKCKVRRN